MQRRDLLQQPRPARPECATKRARRRTAGPPLPTPAPLIDATTDADVVRIPARAVVSIDGRGAPGGGEFQRCVGAIYGAAYTLKFARKHDGGADFKIGPLEARWWADAPARTIADVPPATWRWRLRIAVPADATEAEVESAIRAATTRKGGKLEGSAEAKRVTLDRIPAARMGRVLHVGPYAAVGASVAKIRAALDAAGLAPAGAHVEVYLNDPRTTKPEKLKTVLLLELAAN